MFGLVNTYFSAAGKGEVREFSPTLFAYLRDLDLLRFKILQSRRDVIAHKVKLVLVVVLGIMERGFQRRHGENEPAVASVNGGKFKYIAKEGPVSFWMLGVDDDMRAIDQA